MTDTFLNDERSLASFVAGVHMTLLRRGHRVFPGDVLADLRIAVLRAADSELRTDLLVALELDEVLVTTAGQYLESAIERLTSRPAARPRGYR